MKPIIFIATGIVAFTVMLTSCAEDPDKSGETPISKIEANVDQSDNSTLLAIDGNLFSISCMMGADMGYASVHDQQMKSLEQFKTLSSISESLNLGNAVDQSLIKRLANNANNKDSLLLLVSEFYREADAYLEKEKRMDVAAWIIAGGWIESMHLSLDVVKKGNVKLKEMLASQKLSYKNLLNLVRSSGDNIQVKALMKDLEKLEDIFEEVIYTYNYKKPEIDIDTKTTVLKGVTEYEFTDETLLKLNSSIMELRQKLMNN